jgi:ubiquinone/menaquinone biosynthesis C-methylase UbiE
MLLATCSPRDLKKSVSESYERNASTSNTNSVYQRLENLNVPISKLLDEIDLEADGSILLDLGTGWGVVAIAAAKRYGDNFLAVGLDFSPTCLKLAKRAIEGLGLTNISLILGDAELLPFKHHVFDVAVSQATINLVPNKLRVFSELARVLKEGAVLAFSDAVKREEINQESLDLWCNCVTGALTIDECERIMKLCGLTIEDVEDLTGVVRDLVKTGKWSWQEFLEHELGYLVVKARKTVSSSIRTGEDS